MFFNDEGLMSIKNFAFMLGATAVFGLVQNSDCMDKQSPKQPEPNKNQRLVSFVEKTTPPQSKHQRKGFPIQRTYSYRPGDNVTCAEQVEAEDKQPTATSVSSFSDIMKEEEEKAKQEKTGNPDSDNVPVKFGDDNSEEEEDDILNKTFIIPANNSNKEKNAPWEYDYDDEEEDISE